MLTADQEGSAAFLTPDELLSMGWKSTGPFPAVIGDALTLSTCRVVRLWSQGGTFSAQAKSGGQCGRVRVVVGALGSATALTAGGDLELGPKNMLLTNADKTLEIRATQPWARYIWEVELATDLVEDLEELIEKVFPVSDFSWSLFVSLSNSALQNAGVSGDARSASNPERGARFLGEAFSYAMSAIIADSIPLVPRTQAITQHVYDLAAAIIELRYRDPALTPSVLARELSVSLSTLYRAFQLRQTSPAKKIEERRRLAAVSSIGRSTEVSAKEAALAAGFASARQMRNALTRRAPRAGGVQE